MCRFLLAKSETPIKPLCLLDKFTTMAQKSRTFDGDEQKDGWGISWVNNEGKWCIKKSLSPIWEDRNIFDKLEASKVFLIHARSASFAKDEDVIKFNQPYNSDQYSFVFNGLLQGVSLLYKVDGQIGAQKIWNILQDYLEKFTIEQALENLKNLIIKNTKRVQALNIGISDKKNIYSLCFYTSDPDYYKLRYFKFPTLKLICSEELSGYQFDFIKSDQIVVF